MGVLSQPDRSSFQTQTLLGMGLQENARNIENLHILGVRESMAGNHERAIALIGEAIALNPTVAAYHSNLGLALERHGQLPEAADCFRAALQIDPSYINALFNLAKVLFGQGLFAEAIDRYRQALQKNPNDAPAYFNLGSVYLKQDLFIEAAECFRTALAIKPDYADAHNNLGLAYSGQQDFGRAAECYQRAFAFDAQHPSAFWNLSLLRLLQGDLQSGWRHYERRSSQPGQVRRSFTEPLWDGTPLQGKAVLLYGEQGMGDTIQFARFARLVKERGGRVVVECQSALVNLLTGVAGIDQVVAQGQALPPFDVQMSLMSLGGIFQTTLDTIPGTMPYLHADETKTARWRNELKAVNGFKIGVVWQGNPNQPDDRQRSVPLALFAPLAAVPGVQLLSLQVGPGKEQLDQAAFPIIDLGDRFDPNSLDDLAAVLSNLDLVVTVCTSVAHLAGALGVPGMVALRSVPYWCWHLDRPDSPWYPSLRLFRQKRQGDWSPVFANIAAEIAAKSTRST
jgi:tetratricopeptide (TPR) repeat protein